ncbi:MAG: 50S ribosomal protein L29 [Gemmatimonadales bacterium]
MALTQMTVAQIRELTDAELDAKLAEYRKEGFSLRFKAATEVLGNPMDIQTARRTVARLMTVQAERAAKQKKAQ